MKLVLALLLAAVPASAMLYNVDQPVPLSLAHGEYYVGARLWGDGGVMARFGVGLFDRVTFGVSYGGNGLIGASRPEFSDRGRPEFQARLALLMERGYLPDLTLGFDSQGYDDCVNGQFQVREKGGYLCLGKTIDATRTYLQAGVSYWDGPDGFVVLNQLLPAAFEFIVEYDPAFNDDDPELRGTGFLNLGLAWTFSEQVRFGVAVRDILGNREGTRLNRVLDVSFHDLF
jgi:hypothetical protein